MKKIILLSCFLLSLFTVYSKEFSISDSAVISLITCSPGDEVYSKFGHTAIRINDPGNKIDVVFNYGIFSFQTQDFYYKFVKGETDYQLGVYDTEVFLPEYAKRNSMVWEQILNLNPDEKQKILNLLIENYKPENRVYRYNFIFDNCSTRPRDKILAALNGTVVYPTLAETKTFRQWIGTYVGNDTWLKFGIDVVFGIDADKDCTQNEGMFLPEVLMNEFQSAQIVATNATPRKLVKARVILVDKVDYFKEEEECFVSPMAAAICLLVFGVFLTFCDIKNKRYFKPFDTALLLVTGIAGFVALYLMLFSVHPLVKSNLNLLWLNPLNLIVAFLLWFKRFRHGLFFYQILNVVFLLSALIAFALSTQVFNVASFPIIVLLLIRTTNWVSVTKKRLFPRRE